jgi:hypothetical protein
MDTTLTKTHELDAELVAHKLSELRGGSYHDARPVEIEITNGAYISFKMWTGEDEPEEDEDDDREWNLECSTDDLLSNLKRACREAGVDIEMEYQYCDVHNDYRKGIYVDACIDLTNTGADNG